MSRAHLCFLIPLAAAVVGLTVLALMGVVGWPGDVGASGNNFREAPQSGPIKQPVNSYSNVGFVLVGLWAGWQSRRDVLARKTPDWANRLVTTVSYPATLATCSVLIGLGSFALHASMTPWGAKFDHLAMHVWAGWCLAFSTTRLFRANDRTFFLLWAAIGLALLTRLVAGRPFGLWGSTLFGAMITTAVGIELVGRFRNRRRTRLEMHHIAWGLGVFVVADLCRRIDPFCSATSVVQAHAVWHLLCAGSTLFIYLYIRSERAVPPAEREGSNTTVRGQQLA